MFILFQAYSEFAHNGSCPQLRVIFSFYASTIVPALEAAETVTDQIIAKILPNVQLVSNEARDWLQNYIRYVLPNSVFWFHQGLPFHC